MWYKEENYEEICKTFVGIITMIKALGIGVIVVFIWFILNLVF